MTCGPWPRLRRRARSAGWTITTYSKCCAAALPRAEALREAGRWLRDLTADEALGRPGGIRKGVARGERPAREELKAVPKPGGAAKDYRPYAHPCYWAAFILIGDLG
jgi:CHAT domain-containing protein